MGWFDYYKLLMQYEGDLSKATEAELNYCHRANPNDSKSALELAKKKYQEELSKKYPD